jgi:hypothetical protein
VLSIPETLSDGSLQQARVGIAYEIDFQSLTSPGALFESRIQSSQLSDSLFLSAKQKLAGIPIPPPAVDLEFVTNLYARWKYLRPGSRDVREPAELHSL